MQSSCVPPAAVLELQVFLDMHAPVLNSFSTAIRPTASVPDFQLQLNFSEPVNWLADTATAESSSSSSTGSTDTGAATNDSMAAAVTSFSSSHILLTNAALLNISAVPGTLAYLQNGQATGVATAYYVWLRSWSGAMAAIEVQGAAYQDLSGNKGEQDKRYTVSVAAGLLTFGELQLCCKLHEW